MHRKLIILGFVLLALPALAQRKKVDPISFGTVTLGEGRKLSLSDFEIHREGELQVEAFLVPDSLQWIRLNEVLLIPRMLFEVRFQGTEDHRYSISYSDQKIIPLFEDGRYTSRIFVSLFESLPVQIFDGPKLVSTIRIPPKKNQARRMHLIDYSCAPYGLAFHGLENDYVSVGCRIQRTGAFKQETPYLEVFFTSSSHRVKGESAPPYVVAFHTSGESRVKLVDEAGTEELVTIEATLPKKLPRLRLAAGFGPYALETKDGEDRKRHEWAPTAMIYGNFTLNETSSLRFFDSFSQNLARFHNWGLYYAWELAEFCDLRCSFTSLIGVQGIDFRYNSGSTSISEIIHPQGFEFEYKHPFGLKNHKFVYGMFASLSGQYDYTNIWVRYGKVIFWELNYIEWGQVEREAKMWGLSVGFPLASFF